MFIISYLTSTTQYEFSTQRCGNSDFQGLLAYFTYVVLGNQLMERKNMDMEYVFPNYFYCCVYAIYCSLYKMNGYAWCVFVYCMRMNCKIDEK